jgi:hypothetical protein
MPRGWLDSGWILAALPWPTWSWFGDAASTFVLDLHGPQDGSVLQAGACKIGTPSKGYFPPEVKCGEKGCTLAKWRYHPIRLGSKMVDDYQNAEAN